MSRLLQVQHTSHQHTRNYYFTAPLSYIILLSIMNTAPLLYIIATIISKTSPLSYIRIIGHMQNAFFESACPYRCASLPLRQSEDSISRSSELRGRLRSAVEPDVAVGQRLLERGRQRDFQRQSRPNSRWTHG